MIKIKNKKLIYFTFYINNISFLTNEEVHNQFLKEEQNLTEKKTNTSPIEKTTFLKKYINMKSIKIENLIKSLLTLLLIILFLIAFISLKKKNISFIENLIKETDRFYIKFDKHKKENKAQKMPEGKKFLLLISEQSFLKQIEEREIFKKIKDSFEYIDIIVDQNNKYSRYKEDLSYNEKYLNQLDENNFLRNQIKQKALISLTALEQDYNANVHINEISENSRKILRLLTKIPIYEPKYNIEYIIDKTNACIGKFNELKKTQITNIEATQQVNQQEKIKEKEKEKIKENDLNFLSKNLQEKHINFLKEIEEKKYFQKKKDNSNLYEFDQNKENEIKSIDNDESLRKEIKIIFTNFKELFVSETSFLKDNIPSDLLNLIDFFSKLV